MSTSSADVSIVVIAYNEVGRIADCIAALMAQETTRTFEVVVVDDGSSDGTSEVITRLRARDGRLRSIRLETNSGRGVARRAGVEACRGGNVAFVDADIVVPPTWLEQLSDDLPGAAAISGIAVPDGDVAALARIFRLTPRAVPGSATITGNNVIFDGAVLRTTPIPASRLGEDFRLAERLRSEGHLLRSRPDVLVRHDERKTYSESLRWLFDSGVDATSLLFEFRRVRLPDVIAIAWSATTITSLVLAFVITPWLALVPLLAATAVAFAHVATRFGPWPHPLRWLAAAFADVPLIGTYLAGRVVGVVALHRTPGSGPEGTPRNGRPPT